MDRLFERAGRAANASADDEGPQARVLSAEDRLRQETAPMTSKDAAARITLAWHDKDYFRLLQLPYPEADELGRAVWSCSESDVAKSYRRISILVHPDKHPGEAARQAFEHLNQAYRLMKDPGKLEEVLKEAAVKARALRERREATASASERIALNAQKIDKARELRKQQGQSFQEEILQQVKKRQEEAQRKRQMKANARRSSLRDDDEGEAIPRAVGGSDDEKEWRREQKGKRRKPSFL